MHRVELLIGVVLLMGAGVFEARGADSLQDRVQAAKSGQVVHLPPGEFRGGVTLPAGVSLQGAGYGKTIIDAAGAKNGLVVRDGSGAMISDLTVSGATSANILVQDAEQVTIQRIRSSAALIGVSITNGRKCRLENLVSDGNHYGIVLAGGNGNVVVNCTAAGNASVGLSFASGNGTVAFNNCISDSATAVFVGDEVTGLLVDHNLYLGLNIGKFRSQTARNTLNNWKYLSSQDAHSVSIPVKYENAVQGLFATTNTLDWALDRPATAGWGATKLGGETAPAEDIEGKKRPATPGLGAFESTAAASRPADGTLTVASGVGLTSAGVFDLQGKLVTYLFQGLPLPAGEYSFWLPARSYKGRNIEAGQYEVRVLESQLDWEYVGWVGNTDQTDVPGSTAPAIIEALAFDNDGRLMVGRGISEEHVNVHALDGATGKWLWSFKGTANMRGLAVASDGLLYSVRSDAKEGRVSRLHSVTGKIAPWGQNDYGQTILKDGLHYSTFAPLGELLFYADTKSNVVRVGTIQSPEPTKTVGVLSPESATADSEAKVVWVISGGEKLIAISADGTITAEAQPVPQPIALAARDGRLAVASKQTGKIHLFNASVPTQLKPLFTLGRGDGPDGLLLSDRFLFQGGAMPVKLAFGPKQELAVGEEEGRLQVFDRDGKLLWSSFSTGGWAIMPSKATPGRIYTRYFTLMLDSEKGTWNPESYHPLLGAGEKVGDFQVQGQTFVAINAPGHGNGVSFLKFTPENVTLAYGILGPQNPKEPWTYRVDNNLDGVINAKDAVVAALVDSTGQPLVKKKLFDRFNKTHLNGDITSASTDGWLTRWPCAGLDKQGHPLYRARDRVPLPGEKSDLVSPYDFKAGGFGSADHEPRSAGGWMCLGTCSGNPARSYINNGGTDLIGVDKNGVVEWVHPFGQYSKIGSLDMEQGTYIAALAETYDFFVVNGDGLLMQGFSFPERARYVGHWVDHQDTVVTFSDKAGKTNVLTCDYMSNRNHWFILRNKTVRETKAELRVSEDTTVRLAALPTPKLDVSEGKPASPVVHIPKLTSPMPIDGDLQKWRTAGIAPIIITPEAAVGIEGGPRDCSALVRLAYHNQNLYVQVLRFDDIITTHQPQSRLTLQDTVEICVNGFWEGVKHNLSLTNDNGPVNQVDGRRVKSVTLDHQHSPLVIKTLNNAETITERQLIESIFGVDLRDCKVQLFETKIPMDENTYASRPEARFELKSGQQFWLGFLIDDNDQPGTDVQNFLLWPATYGTFGPKEAGAIAVLE